MGETDRLGVPFPIDFHFDRRQQFGEANAHYAAAIGIEDREEYHVATARCNLANQQYALALQNWQGQFVANGSPPVRGKPDHDPAIETASLLRRLPPVR